MEWQIAVVDKPVAVIVGVIVDMIAPVMLAALVSRNDTVEVIHAVNIAEALVTDNASRQGQTRHERKSYRSTPSSTREASSCSNASW